MKKKRSFIKLTQAWGIVCLIGLGVSFVAIDTINSYRDLKLQAHQIRTDFIDRQKQLVKQEVDRVVDMIRYEKTQSETLTRKTIKSRVYEAYSIAEHIYQRNHATQNEMEIQQMILDALRPIRFENGKGYYFITRLDGVEVLFADRPEMEGSNLLNTQDMRGRYVIRDMIKIAEQSGEGFYEYLWTKPNEIGNDFKKISFIKRFEPYDWLIGTGLYVDDVENQIKANLLSAISRIRFGQEGYIFVNKFNGDALVSNGTLFNGTRKLWEIFNDNPDKMKGIFEKEYHAALKPEGDFIYYSHIKLTKPNEESPKVSFIYGIPDLHWLVGAGVYLDDVETNIALMHAKLNNQIERTVIYFILISTSLIGLFFLFFSWLNHRLKSDMNLFISFFKKAAHSDVEIERERIKFVELDQIAEYTNKMLSDRKQAVCALKESEEQFKAMFELASIGMCQAHPETGQWLRVNQKMCEITGYSSDEMLTMCVREITHPKDRERDWEAFQRVVRGESGDYRLEKRYIRKDGTPVWVNVNMTVIRDSAGQPMRTMATVENITERKRTEAALRESEEKYRNLFENAPVGIFRTNSKGEVLSVNNAMAGMLGLESPQDALRHYSNLARQLYVHAERREQFLRLLRQEGHVENFEYEAITADGRTIWLNMNARVESCSDDGLFIIEGFTTDITERKTAEKEKETLQAQLHQAQKMESIGRLAGGVAHDFNNMLGVIIGHTEMAIDEIDPSHPVYNDLQEILKAAYRSANLTRQLLAFARKQTISPRVLDLNETVGGMLNMLRRLIGEDIDLLWKPGLDIWPVKVDPTQIDQILANLCVNARDAIEDIGRVTIETANVTFDEAYCREHAGVVPGEYVMLAVSDDGCGMEKETLENLFEPFFTTKEFGKGTGLGLATVYGIVQQNQGFVNVYSEPDQGTTFKMYLPKTHVEIFEESRQGREQKPLKGIETILLVEDEEAILALGKTILERHGYMVLTARNPKEALDLMQNYSGPLDLLITDLVMPGMNGKDLVVKLGSVKSGFKHIFMSGYTANVITHRGILDKGINFLQKPFSVKTMVEKVRSVLDG